MPARLSSSLISYGIYDEYRGRVPQIMTFTDIIPALVGTEFGMVVNVKDGRGESLDFVIEHPPFKDKRGRIVPAFSGELHIRTRDYDVFVGDAIWDPWQDLCGLWTLRLSHQGRVLHQQLLTVVPPDQPSS